MVAVGIEVWKGVRPNSDRVSVSSINDKPLEGLAATDLRGIPVASVLAALWDMQQRSEAAHNDNVERAIQTGTVGPEFARTKEDNFRGRHNRVSPDDMDFFRRVADVYNEAMRSPGRKRPTGAVEMKFDVAPSTASKWVRRARELGLLPPTVPGKPSAHAVKIGRRRK